MKVGVGVSWRHGTKLEGVFLRYPSSGVADVKSMDKVAQEIQSNEASYVKE